MANDYYDHTGYPANGAYGTSSALRSELDLIEQAFSKLPTLGSSQGKKLIAENSSGSGLEPITTIDGSALTSLRVSSTGGIGYGGASGTGGTVTQATSKTTTVVLNKICGQITMNNAALASGAKATFTVTNSTLATGDGVIVWIARSLATVSAYRAEVTDCRIGDFTITVENITGGSLSEAVVIGFAVFKATFA